MFKIGDMVMIKPGAPADFLDGNLSLKGENIYTIRDIVTDHNCDSWQKRGEIRLFILLEEPSWWVDAKSLVLMTQQTKIERKIAYLYRLFEGRKNVESR